MNPSNLVFAALKTLCEGRVYPDHFPQEPSIPTWPAIRYTGAGGTVYPDLCGDGDSDEDDARVQIDVVAKTDSERHAILEQVRARMKTMNPPCIVQGPASKTWDGETKTFRGTIDYIIYGSSVSGE